MAVLWHKSIIKLTDKNILNYVYNNKQTMQITSQVGNATSILLERKFMQMFEWFYLFILFIC